MPELRQQATVPGKLVAGQRMMASAWASAVDIPACSVEDIAGAVGRGVHRAVEAEEESSLVRHTAMAPCSGHHKAKGRMES